MNKLTDIFQRVLLSLQYSDKQDLNPADQLTLTLEEIKEHTNTIKQALMTVIQRVKSPADQPTGQRQISAVQETNESATATLNATNLHQHQIAMQTARQATFQKNNASNRAPAAPTSPQPPFTFGAQSPQGLAKYPDKPNGLTQDKLSLPSTKRRKGNQVTTTAAKSVPTPGIPKSAQVNKSVIPDAQPAAPVSRVKRPLQNYQSSLKEFGTQIELDAHKSEVHGPKEPPIEDPLQWTLQQARLSVGLDETGKSTPRPEQDVLKTPKIKTSGSEPAQHLNKQERSTAMARVQSGRSPVFHLKTPQASVGIKTLSSEAKSSDMDGNETHTSEKSPQKPFTSSPDPWASSHIPPAVINHSWPDLPDASFIGPWTTIQNALTPTSTHSSGKSEKNSPRISDISENDTVKINLVIEDDSEWANMFEDQIFGDIEALNEDSDQLGMDWETAFGLEELAGGGQSGELGIAAGVSELTIDNNDWMKIYAPESMDQSNG